MKPDIYLYNPTCEIATGNGTLSYMPNRMLRRFERDLDGLPLFFAKEKDVLLVHQMPSASFLETLNKANFPIPSIKLISEALDDDDFIHQPKNRLCPWGWSPVVHHQLRELKASCSEGFKNHHVALWSDQQRELYSRKAAMELLQQILQEKNADNYIQPNQGPVLCNCIEEVEVLFEQWPQMVLKAPWSSSGRGIQVLRYGELNQSVTQWISGNLKSQGYIMAEPLLNKMHDFATQFEIREDGSIKFLGHTHFSTNSNGQYHCNYLGGLPLDADPAIREFLTEDRLQQLVAHLKTALENSPIAKNYQGFLGIDHLLIREMDGNLRIHPCLEINLRYNMGTLALILEQHMVPESRGSFHIFFQPGKSFAEFSSEMEKKHPLSMEDGKLKKGYLPLVDPGKDKAFGAYLLIS
jgi:hypothetical protein